MITETKPCTLLSMFGAVKRALLVVNNVHGSGFDGDWTMEIRQLKTKTLVVLHGSFHMMDEWGSYDGWADFEVRIDPAKPQNCHISFGKNAPWYKIYKYMIPDFLYDVIGEQTVNYLYNLNNSKLEISKLYYFKGILK
jgi:hypothetical protein